MNPYVLLNLFGLEQRKTRISEPQESDRLDNFSIRKEIEVTAFYESEVGESGARKESVKRRDAVLLKTWVRLFSDLILF